MLYECRARLEALQDSVPDRRFEAIIIRTIPPNYEFLRHKTYRNRTMGVPEILPTSCDAYIDEISRSANEPAVAKPCTVMRAEVSHTEGVACHQQGHRMCDCSNKQQRPSGSKKYNRGRSAAGKGGDGQQNWCTFHRTIVIASCCPT